MQTVLKILTLSLKADFQAEDWLQEKLQLLQYLMLLCWLWLLLLGQHYSWAFRTVLLLQNY